MAGICCLETPSVRLCAPPLLRLLRVALTRYYRTSAAAAAQPQLDNDHYYYGYQNENELPPRHDQPSLADSEGSVPLRGVQWAFIGSPGAKKHVYAEKLSKLLEVPHISMGSLVRQDLSPGSSLYQQIANAVNQGKLVPEEIIFGLLSKRLEDGYYRGETGFILDGIPRTQIQAEILDQLVDIDLVVNFKCTEDCLLEHGSSMFTHSRVSDGCSNSASTRIDMASQDTQSKILLGNTESARKEKVHAHAKQIKPLEDYYRKQKKLVNFQVSSAPGETWQGLLAALDIRYINATPSKLTLGSSWL
ncbi:hypothetical protein F0562_023292 [Nyssa sinensis]|uniref:adenylate kinase n=1 Tax=Nyssa sinensis TaxID=561372 RepID=A0A5J5BIQ3_9ASTE|nr:hypothetical protein F0562_023292 [Nyssa sinensis]